MDRKDFVLYPELKKISPERVAVINFASSTCKPCKEEIPELIKLHAQHRDRFELWIVFVGDTKEAIQKMKEELGIPASVLILQDPIELSMKKLKYSGFPITFIVKPNRELVYQVSGFTIESINEIKKRIVNNDE